MLYLLRIKESKTEAENFYYGERNIERLNKEAERLRKQGYIVKIERLISEKEEK